MNENGLKVWLMRIIELAFKDESYVIEKDSLNEWMFHGGGGGGVFDIFNFFGVI